MIIETKIFDDYEALEKFISASDNFVIEQNPKWVSNGQFRYFYIKNADKVSAYAKIKEINIGLIKFALLQFGPSFIDKESGVELIDYIIRYYKRKNFVYLSIRLCLPVSSETEFIEHVINKRHKIKYIYKSGNLWSTVRISLNGSLEDIFRKFRKGHKSDIKKAQKSLTVKEIENETELNEYFSVFKKMSSMKKVYESLTFEDLKNLFNFLQKNKSGFILGVYKENVACIGGVVIVSNGQGMRYYQGASDPEIRDLPILHLAIYKSVVISKEFSKSYLDLWGYNIYAKEGDPVCGINNFKKGFSNEIIFSPKTMHINLKPFGRQIFFLSVKLYNKIKSSKYVKKMNN